MVLPLGGHVYNGPQHDSSILCDEVAYFVKNFQAVRPVWIRNFLYHFMRTIKKHTYDKYSHITEDVKHFCSFLLIARAG